MAKKIFVEAVKYGVVGVMNTLLTALTIGIIMYLYRLEDENVSVKVITISNMIGYAVGLVNSFIWNRNWTFHSKVNWKIDFLKFMGVFVACYIPQLFLVNGINYYASIPSYKFELFNHSYLLTSAYICQLIGIAFYTILNFLCNKFYTFKK
jgi:putative flippase GtrA